MKPKFVQCMRPDNTTRFSARSQPPVVGTDGPVRLKLESVPIANSIHRLVLSRCH